MKWKLRLYFDDRIPLTIRRRNNVIYFQLQLDVANADRYRFMTHCEFYKTACKNVKEIGILATNLLKRFEETGDLSIAEFEKLVGMKADEYIASCDREYQLKFMDAKNHADLARNYDECSIGYFIPRKKYSFTLWRYERGYNRCSDSTGERGILTFETPLEFTDYSDPEALGRMIIEALDRSRMLSDKIAGNHYPSKTIELLNESALTVSAPRDRHFIDEEDNGVCEIYQLYGYYPREDSEERSAGFYLGIAAELNCDISEENIRSAWEKLHGKSEFFEVKPIEYGIFRLRAEMRNKSVHRISYLLKVSECELLDCTMELHKPNSRKKLDEKLSVLFEEFARRCKFNT